MASEISKNVKVLDEQEVTSQQRDQSARARASASAAEEQADPLARQSSIMSLTLEELQYSLCEPGRNFGSMNMDEFMANIWHAEEFQAATGGCKEATEREPMAVAAAAGENGGAGGSGLVRQGSFALPPPLSRKTVEEVWAEINQGGAGSQADAAPQAVVQPQMGSGGVAGRGRQVTLGEMTLEDFLVKAGVVRGAFAGHAQAVGMVPAGPMGMQMQQGQLAAPLMYQASEMSKNVKVLDEQEVTSQQRDQSARARAGASAAEEQADPLARQSSIMSLTLEELQNSLCEPGRNFGSMSMDEFMANIWNAEEFQAATGGCKEATDREPMAVATAAAAGENGGAGGSGLVRQGSFALPPPLSRKTVEEVRAEINQSGAGSQADAAPQAVVQPQMGSGGVAGSGRQMTLGEMTLGDFLVKAGVVRGAFAGHAQAVGMVPAGPMGMQMQQGQLAAPLMYQVAAQPNAVYQVMGEGMGYHNGYPAGMAVVPPPPPWAGAVCPGSSDGVSAMTQAEMMGCIGNGGLARNGGGARKRDSPEDGCTEKTVERRQRRMIKNRDSAAQSRARKQAYTVGLEAELNHLKEENERLGAEEKTILLSKKKMLVEKMMEQARENVSAKKSGRGLRRCGSAMW